MTDTSNLINLKTITSLRNFYIFSSTIILMLYIGVNCTFAQSKWDETASRQVYTYILNDIERLSLTDATKKEFALVCLSKFKKALPKGLTGISQERFKTLALSLGKETFNDLNNPKLRYWIIAKEDKLYKDLKKQYTTITTDKKNLKILLNCTLGKLFSQYPYGLEMSSERERFDIYYNLGYECSKQIETPVIKWNPTTEDALRIKIYALFEEANFSDLQKITYTTCFIEKMKKKYPNGMSGNLEKEFESAMTDCLENRGNR